MALFRSNLQILSKKLSNPKLLIDVIENSCENTLNFDKKQFWSWFHKEKRPIECSKCDERVHFESSCRRRLPECPEHICSGSPSKCLEKGYGKRIKPKKRSWFSFRSAPIVIKEKPSNCAPPPCKKELTFKEYIFGPEEPLPDPMTCRRALKYRQWLSQNDPRLEDARYKRTEGDVLLFTEAPKFKTDDTTSKPQPKAPPPYRPPNSVICKKISDRIAGLDCFCVCVTVDKEPCESNLCPVHSKPFKFPYEEMKPRNPRKKFFTCSHGISPEDVILPPRRESCHCMHSAFMAKANFPPPPESCAFHEASDTRNEHTQLQIQNRSTDNHNRKLSRCERLKMITTEKEAEINLPKFARKVNISCDQKCKNCFS